MLVGLLAGVVLSAGNGEAQQLSVTTPHDSPGVPGVSSVLVEAVRAVPPGRRARMDPGDVDAFRRRGLQVRPDGKVFVEIIGPRRGELAKDLDLTALDAKGVEVGRPQPPSGPAGRRVEQPLNAVRHRAEAWLPIARAEAVAASLPPGYFIQAVAPLGYDEVAGQGPGVIGSAVYRNAGADGTGLTFAVLDGGFEDLTAAQTNGDAPASYTAINYTGAGFETDGSHGTGCVEAAFDHAPGATWRIYKVNSVTDVIAAVTDAIANGVDVITHSLSWYNEGWADDTGDACAAANDASASDILFFTAAGNRAESHYQGVFTDADGDGFHEFATGDETIDVTIGPNDDGGYYLSWSNSHSDFDFFLYQGSSSNWTTVASSTNVGTGAFEWFEFDTTNPTATYHLAVWRRSGSTTSTIEMFSHNAGNWAEHAVAAGSTTSPSNCTGGNVVSVGAVSHLDYGDPNGSDVVRSYSSRGPSNSGMTLPDVSGPTDTTGLTYPAGFGGTSCATPNVAGAATAFWSADLGLTPAAIRWLIEEQADLWRDWGTAGDDTAYGRGGMRLTDYKAGTRWVARSYSGTLDDGSVPFHTIAGAYADVPANGRLLIFGDSYSTFPGAVLLDDVKPVLLESVLDSGSAVLGN